MPTPSPTPCCALTTPFDAWRVCGQERIEGIVKALRDAAPGAFALDELQLTPALREATLPWVRCVHRPAYLHWLENVYASAGAPVVADTFPASRRTARLPRNAPLSLVAGYWIFDSWTPVVIQGRGT